MSKQDYGVPWFVLEPYLEETPDPAVYISHAPCYQCGTEGWCLFIVYTPSPTTNSGLVPMCADCIGMAGLVMKATRPIEDQPETYGYQRLPISVTPVER